MTLVTRLAPFATAVLIAAGLVHAPATLAQETVTLKMAHQWPDDPNDYVGPDGQEICS